MNKEKIIALAKENYPPGTIFTPAHIHIDWEAEVGKGDLKIKYSGGVISYIQVPIVGAQEWIPIVYIKDSDGITWAKRSYIIEIKDDYIIY